MDSIYILPVVLDHLENPTETTAKILFQQGIDKETLIQCGKIKPLLQYHYNAVVNNFKGDYKLLQDGLSRYWNEYLYRMWPMLEITGTPTYLLDYGCGAGFGGDTFKHYNPEGLVTYVDRDKYHAKTLEIDFENEPTWYTNHKGEFDYILLSEVLHCKSLLVRKYLIETCHYMLREGGSLIINENVDFMMEYRISKIKGGTFRALDQHDITELTYGLFRQKQLKTIKRHNIYEYERV